MTRLLRRPRGEKGFALVITLLVTALIVAVLGEIVFSVHMDSTATGGYLDYQNAGFMARDGLPIAVGISRDINAAGYTYIADDKATESFSNSRGDLDVSLTDESGRLSINAIVYKNGEINQGYYDMYVRLLEGQGLPVSLAGTLADWIDSDDSVRKDGGENSDYYMRQSPPYMSKGGPLSSVEELYLIKGYGAKEVKTLKDFVTVNTNGKVNINTAPQEVIKALLPEITDDMARDVLSYRKNSAFQTTADIRKVSGFETIGFNMQSSIIVKSDIFRAFITARVGKSKSMVEALFKTKEDEYATYYYRQR